MRYARALLSDISRNPIARAVLACLLLLASLGGLSGVAYTDNYVNGGVTWGRGTPPVTLTDVNPMGINLFLEKEVEQQKVVQSLDMARRAGFTWIRQGFAWNDIEISAKGNYTDTRNPGKVVSSWDKYDFIVDQALAHGMVIMARLDSPPVWARSSTDDVEKYHKGPPRDPNDYGDFAAAVASRYKGKIRYYQIWNEPNLLGEWGGKPVSARQYVALLKIAHDRIKEIDPDAVIISAALAPTTEVSAANKNDILFLEDMYKAGGAPYFDVMSTMLYGLGQPPDDRRTDIKRLSFSRAVLLHDVMLKYNDGDTPIWISEYAWLSYPDDLQQQLNLNSDEWTAFQNRNIWGRPVDEQTQGRYLVEGYERARLQWPWMGVMFVWHLRNPDGNPLEPATYFSILRDDFTPRPAYNALLEYSKVVPQAPNTQDRPLPNVMGLLIAYGIFGLLSLASFAYLGTSVAGWAQAALDRPRGRYSPQVREMARNGAAIAGMIVLFLVYYRIDSLFVMLAALAGYGVIAILKPSVALALVAVAIPFFWYPKQFGSQQFQVAETLILIAFAALVARRVLAALFPNLEIVKDEPNLQEVDNVALQTQGASAQPKVPAVIVRTTQPVAAVIDGNKTTRPLPVMRAATTPPTLVVEEDQLAPAQWPARPVALMEELAKPIVVNWPTNGHQPAASAKPQSAQLKFQGRLPKRQSAARNRLSQDSIGTLLAEARNWTKADPFAFQAVVLLLIGAISLWTLVNREYAADSGRAYRWIIIEPVLLYFLLTDLVRTRRGLLRILDFFVATGVFVAMIGLWQYLADSNTLAVEGVNRVQGVYRHPNNLALYLDRIAPFAACIAIFLPWGWRKVLYGLACVPLFTTFLLTFSRGAWVALAIALVVGITVGVRWPLGWVKQRISGRFQLWLAGVSLAAGLAVLAVAFVFPTLPDRILNPSSGLKRVDIWISALKMGADHPIFGIGLDQFLNQYQRTDAEGNFVYIKVEQSAELYTAHPHNIVLDWWLALGIMGLFVLVWLLWRFYKEALLLARSTAQSQSADPVLRAIILGLIASMTAFLIHGLVDNSYFLMDLALIFWLSCGALQLSRMLYKRNNVSAAQDEAANQ